MTNYFLQQVFRVAAVFAMLATPAVYAANTSAPTPIAGQPGQVTAIAHWQIQSTA
jgi:hypothetical protein